MLGETRAEFGEWFAPPQVKSVIFKFFHPAVDGVVEVGFCCAVVMLNRSL